MVITGLSEKPLGLPRPTPKDTQDMSEYEVFAKVPNLFFFQSVFHFISSKDFDFSHFSKSEALLHGARRASDSSLEHDRRACDCAVGGLYSRRLNHKMPGVMTRSN